ncbi:unnamed protein product [Prorocentrum cordatum]|uniref:Uncharacterized protein n=1 Tax=Prorocentrum cordatum TaxID=2364126 RepID=A0ABN9UEM8_9DINO|nr:unnamed protein product [Polarella glacialis]
MRENPALFDSAVEEELEALAVQRDEEEDQKAQLESDGIKEDTLVLRRRMDEVRQAERTRIVTELLYLKVCRKFQQLQVPLIPPLKAGGDVKFGAIDLKGLTTDVYSADALELVREHLFHIIGQRGSTTFATGTAVVQISLFQAGQVYGMSALFGYYLRRVDARYQLEKLAGNFGAWGEAAPEEGESPFAGDKEGFDSLQGYINQFGPEEVQRMTTIASVEAQMAMESQVAALFGDLRTLKEKLMQVLGMVRSNEEATRKLEEAIQNNEVQSLRITSDDLRRLVLEAVAYGSLLNDSEKQTDSFYELTPSSRPMGAIMGDDEDEGRYLSECGEAAACERDHTRSPEQVLSQYRKEHWEWYKTQIAPNSFQSVFVATYLFPPVFAHRSALSVLWEPVKVKLMNKDCAQAAATRARRRMKLRQEPWPPSRALALRVGAWVPRAAAPAVGMAGAGSPAATASTVPEDEAQHFQGDGGYVGDGGVALEQLWASLPWREIRNCPGRYTTSDRAARAEDLVALLGRCGFAVGRAPLVARLPGKDPMALFRLPGGGGLLTYCRPEGFFVHTLNTESGLARKVDALGLGADAHGLIGEEVPWSERAPLRAVVAVLPFLADREKNASAYALVLALRRAAALQPGAAPERSGAVWRLTRE